MNKIEEILQSKETYDLEYPTISISDAIEAIKEFGRLTFEAGVKEGIKQLALKVFSDEGEESYTYEDFLKEIENERD